MNNKVVITKIDGTQSMDNKMVMGCYDSWDEAEKWLLKIARHYGPAEKIIHGWKQISFEDGTLFTVEKEEWLFDV